MKLKKIISEIENIAPPALALDWDNTGLLIGDEQKQIKKILLTIDITNAVLKEARTKKTDLILSYHPVIWQGLKTITQNGPGRIVYELIKSDIAVYSVHTAFDIVKEGVNDMLAEIIGIQNSEPIGDFVPNPAGQMYKLVVFVPKEHVNKLADAIFNAGAGAIGNYSNCGFQTEGKGSFLPLKGANPAIGTTGKIEYVDEIKLESVVPPDKIEAVIEAMKKAHPYEEPAYDVFGHCQMGKFGLGRMGTLQNPANIEQILQNIKKVTKASAAGLIGPADRIVKKAAVCAGSCGKIINNVINANCDLYLTGELKHHHALAAQEANLTCICLSHSVSERFALKKIAKTLKKSLPQVKIEQSKKDKDPFDWKML